MRIRRLWMCVYVAAMVVGRRDIGWIGVGGVSVVEEDGFFAGVVVIIGDGEEGEGEEVVCERAAERLEGVEGMDGSDMVVSMLERRCPNNECFRSRRSRDVILPWSFRR